MKQWSKIIIFQQSLLVDIHIGIKRDVGNNFINILFSISAVQVQSPLQQSQFTLAMQSKNYSTYMSVMPRQMQILSIITQHLHWNMVLVPPTDFACTIEISHKIHRFTILSAWPANPLPKYLLFYPKLIQQKNGVQSGNNDFF